MHVGLVLENTFVAVFDKDWLRHAFFGTVGMPLEGGRGDSTDDLGYVEQGWRQNSETYTIFGA